LSYLRNLALYIKCQRCNFLSLGISGRVATDQFPWSPDHTTGRGLIPYLPVWMEFEPLRSGFKSNKMHQISGTTVSPQCGSVALLFASYCSCTVKPTATMPIVTPSSQKAGLELGAPLSSFIEDAPYKWSVCQNTVPGAARQQWPFRTPDVCP